MLFETTNNHEQIILTLLGGRMTKTMVGKFRKIPEIRYHPAQGHILAPDNPLKMTAKEEMVTFGCTAEVPR